MCSVVQGGCIAECVRYFLSRDRIHTYVVPGLSCPIARLSLRLKEVRWGVSFVLLSHSLHPMTLGGKFAGYTECRKQFLDFKRLSAGICPCKEWASLFLVWPVLL